MRGRAAIVVIVVALVLVAAGRLVLGGRSAVADLRSVPAPRADAHVDASVSQGDVAELGRAVDRSVAYVEGLFEHKFAAPPKLVLFGDTASFSAGLANIFSYSEADAARSASS